MIQSGNLVLALHDVTELFLFLRMYRMWTLYVFRFLQRNLHEGKVVARLFRSLFRTYSPRTYFFDSKCMLVVLDDFLLYYSHFLKSATFHANVNGTVYVHKLMVDINHRAKKITPRLLLSTCCFPNCHAR